MAGHAGLTGLLVVVAALYFTDAGGWVARQLSAVNDNCYAALSGLGAEIANPVCGGVSSAMAAANRGLIVAGDAIGDVKQFLLGDTNLETLDEFTSELASAVGNLASSSDDLARMMSLGPQQSMSLFMDQPFQQAIDSFAIGHGFFKDPATITQGLPWLQLGAQQPMGYGVMSQLALGNVLAKGAPGVPENPRMAAAYLQQASKSIALLSSSNTPQSQQLLKTLPGSPQQMQREIERIMRELQASGR